MGFWRRLFGIPEPDPFLELGAEMRRRHALPVATIPMPSHAATEARWPSMHRDSALKRIKARKPTAKRKPKSKKRRKVRR